LAHQLAEANVHLQELDKLKTEFVSMASHELLTPISAIEGYLSMILDEKIAPVNNPKTRDFLNRIYGASQRLARLVTDLLNVSRIEEGRLVIDKRPSNLEEIIQSVIDELSFKAQQKKLELKFEKPSQPLPQIFADPDRVKEILINLVGNAIKFTRRGGVTISCELSLQPTLANHHQAVGTELAKEGAKYVVVHIKDTGIGIPAQEIPNIFEKFYRGGELLTREAGGTGLGLYITKSILQLLGGKIWVKSEIDKGSTFSFSLPIAKGTEKREISGDVTKLGTEEQKALAAGKK
jgi:signal transduction histidine kinase